MRACERRGVFRPLAKILRVRALSRAGLMLSLGLVSLPVAAAPVSASASAAAAESKPQLLFVDITAGSGVTADEAGGVSEYLKGQIARMQLYRVIGNREIQTLLSVERQKQILGCAE